MEDWQFVHLKLLPIVGVAKASAKTDANGHDDLYAHPIQSDEWKLQIPCHCNEQRYTQNHDTIA